MGSNIQDVARAAGVSISTVSRSFTRPQLVSKATRERVLRVADELNFSLSRSAAALKSGRSLRVAVLLSERIGQWFVAHVIEGLNDVLHAQGYDLSVFQIDSVEDRREFFEMMPVRRNADAVVVVSFAIDQREVAQLASTDVPIIGINSAQPRDHGFSAAVNIDDAQGATLAARHLVTLGHRDIAYVSSAAREDTLDFSVGGRRRAFMDRCRAEGVTVREVVCRTGADGHYLIGDVVTQLMSMETMPSAVACEEDGIAVPLMFQLERSGFAIPGDVSLIGYDDSLYTEAIGLTTVRQEPVAMAHEAARMTLDLIGGHTPDEPFRTYPAQLVVRSSTSRPKAS